MFGLGKRQGTDTAGVAGELALIRAELAELRKRVTAAESEVAETSATALRHLKAAQARERRAAEATEAKPNARPVPEGPTPAAPPRGLWGARRRRWEREQLEATEGKADSNGVHP